MIEYQSFILDNGLKVLVHKDATTPVVAMNIVYNVGAKDEVSELTGFAHLFEHLMFGGSVNIPKYDEPLQKVGGENNAFTNNDITNYYLTLPKENIETAFWIESDRMLNLAFSKKSLEVQRSVVIEEYKQRYLNQPYGDLWLLMRPLIYKVHPYQWATIGKNIKHIEDAKMEDVKDFYKRFYNPNNAIMVIAGDVDFEDIKSLSQKWFGSINKSYSLDRNIPMEPEQKEARFLKVERNVPANTIFKAYHTCDRMSDDYVTTDIISDLLGNGKSSQLHQSLVVNKKLFNSISCFISGDIHPGTIYVAGYLADGVLPEEADTAIVEELDSFKNNIIDDKSLQKVKNKFLAAREFSNLSILDKAMNLAYYELLGDANMVNTEVDKYMKVDAENIQKIAKSIFTVNNSNTLYYLKK
ncbi:MAG: insulinase family protein [Bacteroidetes bacterium]|nr:MAG: insulinase family protein [Bacteroidota bacterium]